jgi:DNA-binding NtrC family response regulator
LQEKEVRPVGATSSTPVDIRVIAASHQDIPARVNMGKFRKDLYARLSGLVVELPDLADRIEDLGLIVSTLLPRVAGERAETISFDRDAARALFCYEWPLNIRELEQALRSAAALAGGGEITLEHLPAAISATVLAGEVEDEAPAAPVRDAARMSDQDLREHLTGLLREHNGNLAAVARATGKARMQVYRWCKRLGIDASAFRER